MIHDAAPLRPESRLAGYAFRVTRNRRRPRRTAQCGRRVLSLLGCLALAACASKPVWTHPTKDSSEWKVDAADCERFFSGSEQGQLACLTQKGWRRSR